MTFNPRMVALDIDGTLVDFEGGLPDSVRKAVAKVDVPVVLATGRGLFGAIPVHEALGCLLYTSDAADDLTTV